MNGLTLLVLIAIAIGIVVAYRAGLIRGTRAGKTGSVTPWRPAATAPIASADIASAPCDPEPAPLRAESAVPAPRPPSASLVPASLLPPSPPLPAFPSPPDDSAERARLVRSLEGETALLRRALATVAGERDHLAELAEDRRRLWREVADARAEAARYRALVIDLENNAPPPLLDDRSAPDDLKLIVGIGPVLERMLHQLGVATYRQIARWSERDIDDFDARLPEFPGRIRRDAWVTQARELHQSKFGEKLAPRER